MGKIHIADLEIGYQDLLKAQAELADGIRATKQSIVDLEKEQSAAREAGKADTDQYQRNAKAIEENKVVLSGLNSEYRNNQTVLTASVAAANQELDTIEKLEARNK